MRAKRGAATALMVAALSVGWFAGGRPVWPAAELMHQMTGDPGTAARVSAGSFHAGSQGDYSSGGVRAVAPQRASQVAIPAVVISANVE